MRHLRVIAALIAFCGAADAQLQFQVSAPVSPSKWPWAGAVSLPVIANTDLVYPGCPIPPTTFTNTWNINPSTGQTQATMTTGGISLNPLVTPHQGDATHPWSSLQAVFTTVSGYTGPLLATVPGGQSIIQAGDKIVLATGSYGDLGVNAQIVNSPALTIAAGSGQTPLFTSINVKKVSGLVLDGTAGSFMVRNHLSGINPIVSFQDASFPSTNIVVNKLDISSDTVANTDGWSQSTWQANGSQGIEFRASDTAFSNLTCTSIVNSHVYDVQAHNNGAINMWSSSSLTQNNEIDHFATDAIEHAGSNVAIGLNYVHDAVLAQPGDQYFSINNVQDQGNAHQANVSIYRNKVIESVDPAQLLNANLGFYISSKGDITNFTAYDNLFAGTAGGIEPGTLHYSLIMNNSLMGGNIDVQQGHAGILGTGTGPVGSPPSYVRVFNNIAPLITLSGAGLINVQADHNISTGTSGVVWVYEFVRSVTFIFATPAVATTLSAAALSQCGCSDSGAANLLDGLGPTNEFTAVATGFPMSTPDWTPTPGSPAATMGGAVLIPPITDYNNVAFTAPYNIGALATTSPPNPTFALPTGDVLHYMSPSGNDSNNGLTAGTAWATPNHALHCGDVIIAAAGSYPTLGNWGAVSNCPSTTGGIDGAGGIYTAVALCGGADLTACNVAGVGIYNASNWAVEGFNSTSPSGICFGAIAIASPTTQTAYVAFINDIAQTCDDGFITGDGGNNHNNPGNGVDEFAVVGDIAYQANNDPICVGAIDDAGPSPQNAMAGTHVIFEGNYAISNLQQSGCGGHDGEGLFFDTFDAHGFNGQSVMENNWVVNSALFGIAEFQQTYNTGVTYPTHYIINNTLFANNGALLSSQKVAGSNVGDINLQQGGTWTIPVKLYNNISRTNWATVGNQVGGGPVYALAMGISATNPVTVGNTGSNPANSQNVFFGMQTTCPSTCLPGSGQDWVESYGNSLGVNTYEDPLFKSTSDLLANRIGAPNCTGFTNTAACEGWNYSAQTAVNPSFIYDLVATAGGTAGKGAKPPGPCTTNALYPTWLKGIVYLHWNGASITENAGLVTKPCNM